MSAQPDQRQGESILGVGLVSAFADGGRQMTKEQIKSPFNSVSGRVRGLYEPYFRQIHDKAKGLDLPKILAEIKSPAPSAGA
jgi:hypothetical protein